MLCKLTSKNQLTLPKDVLNHCQNQTYFDARWEAGHIILEPVIVSPVEAPELAAIRDKIAALDLTEENVADMVAEARRAYGP
jgi:hypothetical protein